VLFNSYEFIFGYLPITFALFFLLALWRHRAAAAWLAAASLFFYGWWNAQYVLLLTASIVFNFFFGTSIARSHALGRLDRGRRLLTIAICANLALLCYYKYAGFLLGSIADFTGGAGIRLEIILPLGISFFTFTQIAFLVDAHQGKAAEYNIVHYFLFVTYFPHLIAGPVLHHKEMMPQFADPGTYRMRSENLAVGLTIFLIGLFKKTVMADGVAANVGPTFAAAASGAPVSFLDAWGAALSYTLQLYFDFSGYSDMAIGLSRMFGVRLPINFNSPYKATNIIDFWRRWHMTLSRFLRDYLYVPLGGNRHGAVRRYINLALTMVLGGLWHGAGWTFVVWGALHGLYLMINHAWIGLRARLRLCRSGGVLGRALARFVTLLAVVVGWVFFRAETVDAAVVMLRGMIGYDGIVLPAAVVAGLGSIGEFLTTLGVQSALGGGSRFVSTYIWIIALGAVALFAPNSQEILRQYSPALTHGTDERSGAAAARTVWRPTTAWALGIAVLGAAGLLSLTRVSEFLYFQF